MRIKASEVRRIVDDLKAKANCLKDSTGDTAFVLRVVAGALYDRLGDAFAWVNITDRVELKPLVLRGQRGDELAIELYDKFASPIGPGGEPFFTWRPGDLEPIEIVKANIAYRVSVGKDRTLVIEACVE